MFCKLLWIETSDKCLKIYNLFLSLSLSQSLAVVERYFPQYAIVGQDILSSKESVDKVLGLLPEDILPFSLNTCLGVMNMFDCTLCWVAL